MTRWTRSCAIGIIAIVACSCGREEEASPGSPVAATPAAAAARGLVVTHTEGFRHSSIGVAEATIETLGRRSGLFTTTFCRTADEVARMLTPAGLAGVDAVVFANTTGTLPIPDLGRFLSWIAEGHGFAGMHSAADTYHDAADYLD